MEQIHKKSIRILITVSTLLTFLTGLFAPFYALFVGKLGGGIEIAGASWAVFSIVSGLMILLFRSWESTIHQKRRIMIGGLFLRSFAFVLFLFITSFFDLIIVQILIGISIALVNPSYDAMFTKHTSEEQAISDWGGWEGLTSIASGLASVTGGFAIKYYGYESVFIPMAVITFCTALYLQSLPKEIL
ncbi:MAG: MFS transporter [Candidatus Pacebacteria bacterium]|nr:MFS transporter [Candidatus Paceibacterota bacterium]